MLSLPFAIRPKIEKGANEDQDTVNLDSYQKNPVYSILLKHHGVLQQKCPSSLPYRDHGEHQVEIDTSEAIFHRQSPVQERVISAWIEKLLASGLIRPSTTPHVRRTLPIPRKDTIIEKMQGFHWYSYMDLLSGYYQFCMRASGVPLTVFQTADGANEYVVLPMGLFNAPATFNAGIRQILLYY
ncbi:reverse transcriptase [Phytophthora megakarya]|uniref:Reverse transcriptase n=1 Tax=Phytophthora megakarya TaxID=4795 RepID=A0A225W2N5_9STRA|nr:reverse transcriptase [Phytophthora megakarya]